MKHDKSKNFFVCRKSRITGKTGRGEKSFPYEEARKIAYDANMADKDGIYYWVERGE
jgi:hypothetical protein